MLKMSSLLFLALLMVAYVSAAPSPPGHFDHHANIVADVYDLYWSIDGTTITFEVHAKTLGYIGFGISRTGGMKGADIVIGWVKDGKVHFQDRNSNRNAMPSIDEEQNWEILSGWEDGNYTVLKFRRPLISCDKENDVDITGETMKLIYAIHPDDPTDASSIDYHGVNRRGTKSVTLLQYGTEDREVLPPDAQYFDLVSDEFEVPAKDTTYWCQALKLQELPMKHHIFKYEPIIRDGHEGLVHHILAYACKHEFNESEYHGKVGECYNDLMGEVDECNVMLFVWAVGGGAMHYPPHVGFPYGGGEDPRMIRLEIHYDNPLAQSGLRDSAGFRIWYTPTLRQYDGAILEQGHLVSGLQAIPPHYPQFISQAYCTESCLSAALPPDEDIKVFSVMMHSHLLGTAMRLRHFREGHELPPLAKDSYYDFNYQDYRPLEKEVSIKPKDHLLLECNYTSSNKNDITWGGLSTRDEMCMAYILHYPKRAFSRCESLTPSDQSLKFLEPDFQARQSFKDTMKQVDWTNETIREMFQNSVNEEGGDGWLRCDDGDHNKILQDQIFQTPEVKSVYVEPVPECTPLGPPPPESKTTSCHMKGNLLYTMLFSFMCALIHIMRQ